MMRTVSIEACAALVVEKTSDLVGITTFSLTPTYVYVNPSHKRVLGYEAEDLIGKCALDFMHADDRRDLFPLLAKYFQAKSIDQIPKPGKGITEKIEFRFRDCWGNWRCLESTGDLLDEEHILFVSRDITEKKALETELRWSNEEIEKALRHESLRNELILQTAVDGFFVISLEGDILKANKSASKICGFSREDLVGRNVRSLVGDEAAAETASHLKRALVKGSDHFETACRSKGGKPIAIEMSTNLAEVEDERFFFTFVRDITDRKQAEAALSQREHELELRKNSLEEANTALKVLLKKRDEDREEIEEKVLLNVKELVLPYLEELRRTKLDLRQQNYADILQSNLENIISPFAQKLSSKLLGLTPAELGVANLVKQGRDTKEIAELLGLSLKTIESYRKSIRRKLGIIQKKVNLRTHLLSFR